MIKCYSYLARFVAIWILSILLLSFSFYIFGIHINYTGSAPIGFYKSLYKTSFVKGDYVYFCPVNNKIFSLAKQRQYIASGFCKGGYGYLLKKVSAVAGDVVSINDRGVFVNGLLQSHSKPLRHDGQDRPISIAYYSDYKLKPNEVLLLSTRSDISFDGRYFGALDKSAIISVLRPLLIW